MLQVNHKIPFQVFEININEFKNYYAVPKSLNFNNIPFASVCQ